MDEMTKHEAAALLRQTITRILADYPDLAGEASAAINAGVSAAMDRVNADRANAQTAMLAALALLPPNRVNDNARSMLASVVSRAINRGNMCPAERAFITGATP